jgi:hypothetical protein
MSADLVMEKMLNHLNNIIMKRILSITLASMMILFSCDGQMKSTDKKTKDNLPQTNIKVNKEYDKNGNIVKYDSTYSSYYSNIKTDSILKDSIFNNFKSAFNHNYFFSNQPYFRNFFFADSLLMYDFYKKDFFYNRFRNNMEHMDSLFREMDIMKNDFFNKQLQQEKKK